MDSTDSITTVVPTKVRTLENTCIKDEFKVWLTFSISFVIRLINSPCCRLSKNDTGNFCKCSNSPVRSLINCLLCDTDHPIALQIHTKWIKHIYDN